MCLISDKTVPLLFAAAVAKQLTDDYENNKEFYRDFVVFNFKSSTEKRKFTQVNFADLPAKITKELNKMYRTLDKPTSKIFKLLCTQVTSRNSYCPLEAKWAFEYYRRYKTWDYFEENKIELKKVLTPLNAQELTEYLNLF